MIGESIDGRYAILRELGKGAMGAVYEARHEGTGRRVALKLITGQAVRPDLVQRFQREARATGAIETQHIVKVTDTGVDAPSGRAYLVMDLLKGRDASQLLRDTGPLKVEVALKIAAQACLGLCKAHEAGIIHRDIKPANLFLDEQDEGAIVVKICDFGIAKVKMEDAADGDHGLTRTGALVGSPLFMAPEQARGLRDIDARADLWSLGVVLYQLLCGRTPFHDIDALGDLIIAICSEPAPPIVAQAPWVPAEVSELVHKALQLDRSQRFQSADEMMAAFRALLPAGVQLSAGELAGIDPSERAPAAADKADSLAEAAMARSRTGAGRGRQATADATRRGGVGKGVRWLRPVAGVAAGVALVLGGYLVLGGHGWMRLRGHAASVAPPAAHEKPAPDPSAVITGNIFSGYFALRGQELLDGARRAGIPLAYRIERDPIKRFAAFNDGSAQFIVTSLDAVLAAHLKGRIVALIDASAGAHALIVDSRKYPGVNDLESLQRRVVADRAAGHKVGLAYPKDSVGEYLLTLLSSRIEAFKPGDFQLTPVVTSTNAYEALVAKDNDVVAAITWEPYVTRARAAGDQVVVSSADVDGAIVEVLLASDAVLAAHRDWVGAVVQRYYRIIDARIVHPHDLEQQIAADSQLSLEEARALRVGVRFFSALGAAGWFGDGTLVKKLAQTAAVLVFGGKLDAAPADLGALIVPEFAAAAAADTRKLVDAVRKDDPVIAERLEQAEGTVAAPAVDAAAIAKAQPLGELAIAYRPFGKAEIDDEGRRELDGAVRRARDFNPRTTAIAAIGRGRDKSAGDKLAAQAAEYLKQKGVALPVVALSRDTTPVGQRDRVRIELVRLR